MPYKLLKSPTTSCALKLCLTQEVPLQPNPQPFAIIEPHSQVTELVRTPRRSRSATLIFLTEEPKPSSLLEQSPFQTRFPGKTRAHSRMCKYNLYRSGTCYCRWMILTKACGNGRNLTNCPAANNQAEYLSYPKLAKGRTCPRHDFGVKGKDDFDRKTTRIISEIHSDPGCGAPPSCSVQ